MSARVLESATTPLLGMNYSNFDQKLAKKQAKREEHNVESARIIHRWRMWEVWQRKPKKRTLLILQFRQGDRIKERELEQLLEDDKVPFSEVILFSSYYYTYMHRAPATVISLVYGLALVTLPLVPKVKGLRASIG